VVSCQDPLAVEDTCVADPHIVVGSCAEDLLIAAEDFEEEEAFVAVATSEEAVVDFEEEEAFVDAEDSEAVEDFVAAVVAASEAAVAEEDSEAAEEAFEAGVAVDSAVAGEMTKAEVAVAGAMMKAEAAAVNEMTEGEANETGTLVATATAGATETVRDGIETAIGATAAATDEGPEAEIEVDETISDDKSSIRVHSKCSMYTQTLLRTSKHTKS